MAENHNMTCGCQGRNARVTEIYDHMTMANAPLAMAYVPFQQWEQPDKLCSALRAGTVFPSLNKPFCGKGGKRW